MSYRTRDLAEIDFSEIDDLISKLTPEEVELLNNEVDPDDIYLPASERVREQTKKAPTGPYNRDRLIKFLEDQGRNEKDWEQNKSFVKEIKGKIWQPPPKPIAEISDSASTEWDEILADASEAEIVELAAILGFTGLVNQVQFHAAQKEMNGKGDSADASDTDGDKKSINFGGWNAAAKAEQLKFVKPEPDNIVDIEETIKKIEANDPNLTTLNLNNIKNISNERMKHLIEAMKENTNVKILTMCNIDMPDSVAKNLVDMLEANKSLLTLNIESNLLTGTVVADICRATLKNETLIDLRLSNQRAQVLGNKVEMDIAGTLTQNSTLLRLGVHFNTLGPRAKVQDTLKKNWDKLRLKRISQTQN